MQPNATEFLWTPKRVRALELVAADLLSDSEIAAELSINKTTLERWKRNPDFADAVRITTEQHRAALRAEGVANKQNQLDALNDRWQRLKQIMDERSIDPEMKHVPGGTTGLIVRTYKSVGFGEDMQLLPEYNIDNTMLNGLLAIEKQGAQLAGFWEDKLNVSGALERKFVIVTEDAE